MKNKKQWIISLRGIACIFIVFLHSVYGWLDNININGLIRREDLVVSLKVDTVSRLLKIQKDN